MYTQRSTKIPEHVRLIKKLHLQIFLLVLVNSTLILSAKRSSCISHPSNCFSLYAYSYLANPARFGHLATLLAEPMSKQVLKGNLSRLAFPESCLVVWGVLDDGNFYLKMSIISPWYCYL